MPMHALEMVLDVASDARIRDEWAALVAAGLPSQAQHHSASNAPHITVLSADREAVDAVEPVAGERLGPLLPRTLSVAGVVVFGGGPFAVARLVLPDLETLAAVGEVRGHISGADGGWVAHVTLARRVAAGDLGRVLEVAAGSRLNGVVVAGLRRWDPDRRETRVLAGR
ncbi:hypothetical protein V6K52_00345 [Knoellia sp. S7-12]|uniref:hypothetical protein n=1 Tax=Knoellia sp. S7-12 TaxID=3126698 RepID=UPI00336868B3